MITHRKGNVQMAKEKGKICEFKGTVERCVYESESFSTYALRVDTNQYPFIKLNKYNNCSIIGELSQLTIGVSYEIIATEEFGRHGYSYNVVNIKRDIPTTEENTRLFLQEILTPNQAYVLYDAYPDILERVKESRLDDIDFSKMPGVGEKTFSVMVRKITETFYLADLVAEFKNVLSLNVLKRIYKEYTSIELLRDRLKKAPHSTLTKVSGIGFKSADSMVLELQNEGVIDFGYDIRTSEDRCYACALHLLNENENEGHTRMGLAELRRQCFEMVPACADHFVDVIKYVDVYYDKPTMCVALQRTYNAEKYIAETIVNNLGSNNVWECDIEKYRSVGEFDLSDEQLSVIDSVCKNTVSILNGFGGTGKSQSAKALINMLDDNNKSYMLLAPTGKASKVLADFTERRASTIHRGLGYMPPVWSYDEEHKLHTDIVIVDETSMVDVYLFKRLVEAIDFTRTKLLMIGDNAQLPSVGCGNLFHDFMASEIIPTVTLTKIFRYGEGGLSKIATDIRNCKSYLDSSMKSKATTFGKNEDYVFVDADANSIKKNVVALYKKLLSKGVQTSDIAVITAKNVGDYGAVILNNEIQKIANKNYGSKICLSVGAVKYFEGDMVMQCKNNYRAKLSKKYMSREDAELCIRLDEEPTAFVANGEVGSIVGIENGRCDIDFDGVIVSYSRGDMQELKLGYAATCHKMQGASVEYIIVCSPQSDIFMLNSNLLYVALTRMKKKCFHIGTVDTINKAIKKKANLTRHTFMQGMLKEMYENKPSESSQEDKDVLESNMSE